MKNPHLVETLVRFAPSTGRRLQAADNTQLEDILGQKLTGNIPELDVSFNIQGVPLILSRQSYVELRLTPVIPKRLRIVQSFLSPPLTFEYNRALWPKVNAACIASASATFSNFGIENTNPMLLPYIRTFQQPEDLRLNASRSWNPSYLAVTEGNRFVYANRYLNLPGTGGFTEPAHRSPYEIMAVRHSAAGATQPLYDWYGGPLLIQIPLEDILPVFQVPVIPLRQTNTSCLSLRLKMRSPRHMFFSAGYFNPTVASSFLCYGDTTMDTEGFSSGIAAIADGYGAKYGNAQWQNATAYSLGGAVVGGGTLSWLKALTINPFAVFSSMDSFNVDFDVDCELVLRVLTNPMLNPLVSRYIQPFINEANEFTAHFTDYYVYSQQIKTNLLINNRFSFTPTQLFYNTTHVVMFFLQELPTPYDSTHLPVLPKALSEGLEVGNLKSLFAHGHFVLRENVDIKDFNILLGSSCVPLFDHPLDLAQMMAVTEDAMKKYSPSEMYGDVMFIQNRLQEGDAFFMFDLTHARNSGFFIDADNMMRVEGSFVAKGAISADADPAEITVGAAGAATTPASQVALQVTPNSIPAAGAQRSAILGNPQIRAGGQAAAAAAPVTQPRTTVTARAASADPLIHVMMVLLWQNTFNVLLDLDGAVLFQQQ